MAYRSPQEIAHEFNESAHYKNSHSTSKLFVYSILGGAFIALGGLLSLLVAGGMPSVAAANPGIVKFVSGALFPLGLILVVIGGAELFTSDCAVIPFALFNGELSFARLARIWTVVYLGNFAGALLVAYLFAYKTGIFSTDPWLTYAKHLAEHKTSGTFLTTFIKGMGANWLVCLAVWLAYAGKDTGSKIIALWFPVMSFVTFGFEHSIANMFFIPTAIFLGADIDSYHFFIVNLLPATLGNIVGGVLFVTLPYWFMFSKKKPIKTNKQLPTHEPYHFNYIKTQENN